MSKLIKKYGAEEDQRQVAHLTPRTVKKRSGPTQQQTCVTMPIYQLVHPHFRERFFISGKRVLPPEASKAVRRQHRATAREQLESFIAQSCLAVKKVDRLPGRAHWIGRSGLVRSVKISGKMYSIPTTESLYDVSCSKIFRVAP